MKFEVKNLESREAMMSVTVGKKAGAAVKKTSANAGKATSSAGSSGGLTSSSSSSSTKSVSGWYAKPAATSYASAYAQKVLNSAKSSTAAKVTAAIGQGLYYVGGALTNVVSTLCLSVPGYVFRNETLVNWGNALPAAYRMLF